MNIIKYALFIAALSLPVTNTHALEWVDYDGTIPDNAVMVNEGVEDRPICRSGSRIGMILQGGKCHSVKRGSKKSKNIEEGYQILVDTDVADEATESHFIDDALAYMRGRYERVALESVRYGIWLASTNIKERIEAQDERFEEDDVDWILDYHFGRLDEGFEIKMGKSFFDYTAEVAAEGIPAAWQAICGSGAFDDDEGVCVE
jgi:hypothetical protein